MPEASDIGEEAHIWEPREYAPEVPRASLRLWLVKQFPPTALNWQKTSELNQPLPDAAILAMIAKKLPAAGGEDAAITPSQINLLWNNPNGIIRGKTKTLPRTYTRTTDAAMQLVHLVFPPIFSSGSSGVLDGMDSNELTKGPPSARRKAFCDRYSALIEPLRASRADLNVARMIAQYDSWMVFLHDLESDLEGKMPPKELIEKTIDSIEALRAAIANLSNRSPLTDLEDYIQINNELSHRCALMKVDDTRQSDLKSAVEREDFFEKAKRFNKLYPWKVDAMMQALQVACCVSDGTQNDVGRMRYFGRKTVSAIDLALIRVGETVTARHPAILLLEPVFAADPKPVEVKQLTEYVKTTHPGVVAEYMVSRKVNKPKND